MATLTLQVISGPSIDRSVVRARGRLLIGRSSNADLRIADAEVNWEHSVIQVGDDSMTLTSLTPNATIVNDRPVANSTRLRDGDIITLSRSSKVRVSAPALRASASRHLVLVALATIAVLAAVVAVLKPTLHLRSGHRDWERSYLVLTRALERSDLEPRVAEEFSRSLQRAWRRERNEEAPSALHEYGELAIRSASLLHRTPERSEERRSLAALESRMPRQVESRDIAVALHGFARSRSEALRGE